jgi:hypothetical protein
MIQTEVICTLVNGIKYNYFVDYSKDYPLDYMIRYWLEVIKNETNQEIDYSKDIIIILDNCGTFKLYGKDYKKWNINTIKAKLMNLWSKLW